MNAPGGMSARAESTARESHLGCELAVAELPLEYDCSENPRSEDFENAYYVRDRYRPTCMRVKGEGAALSRVVCRRPEERP